MMHWPIPCRTKRLSQSAAGYGDIGDEARVLAVDQAHKHAVRCMVRVAGKRDVHHSAHNRVGQIGFREVDVVAGRIGQDGIQLVDLVLRVVVGRQRLLRGARRLRFSNLLLQLGFLAETACWMVISLSSSLNFASDAAIESKEGSAPADSSSSQEGALPR